MQVTTHVITAYLDGEVQAEVRVSNRARLDWDLAVFIQGTIESLEAQGFEVTTRAVVFTTGENRSKPD